MSDVTKLNDVTGATNRREFLARTTKAGAAVGLSALAVGYPGFQARASESTGPNSDIRVACIGVRSKGAVHISGFTAVKGAAVVALCDIDQSVLDGRASALEKKTSR